MAKKGDVRVYGSLLFDMKDHMCVHADEQHKEKRFTLVASKQPHTNR